MQDATTPSPELPEFIENESQLEELLTCPPREVVELFQRLRGGVAIVGGGGKIGPSLTTMASRARKLAGTDQEIIVIDLFPQPAVRDALEGSGVKTVTCDLLDPDAVARLPHAENIIYMAGMKFGTSGRPELTWAVNSLIPDYVSRRYRDSRIVAFSTGCVYDLVPADSPGSLETDPLESLGEYANSCVARERVLQYCSRRYGTKMVLVRLNYAVEMRYGVLVDLAQNIAAGRPVDLTTGYANVIWQGEVNSAVLRLLEHTTSPPMVINLTGPEKISIRESAQRLGELMNKKVKFASKEADTALLSDASKAHQLLGAPSISVDKILEWTANWVAGGGATLGKPTHFQTRDGRY